MNLDRCFPKHPLAKPADATVQAAGVLRDAFRDLAKLANDMLPESREKSLMMTHLEDASTYGVKAIYADQVQLAHASPAEVGQLGVAEGPLRAG